MEAAEGAEAVELGYREARPARTTGAKRTTLPRLRQPENRCNTPLEPT